MIRSRLAIFSVVLLSQPLFASAERFYFIPPKLLSSYESAATECADYLGTLSSVINSSEVDQLTSILEPEKRYWVGLKRSKAGQAQWSSG